ncbi:alanine racemase [Eubacteriales bacterium OttesenSCG-928-A19]|nr:alanine racemase [Eubacteriales bacterium OttesenSCG-928-A19]
MTIEWATARTWAEIDLDKVLFNYRNALAELGPGVRHYVVLKANAYGLGAVGLAKALYGEGARLFAVACAQEALELADVLPPDADILIMGVTMPPEMDAILRAPSIVPSIMSLDSARAFSEKAGELGRVLRYHCKVDTGLHRLGFATEEAVDAIAHIHTLPHLTLEGVFSHVQRRSPEHDRLQAERLYAVRDGLASRGIDVPLLHLLDSIGMWRYPEFQMDAVRDAAFLVGHTPQDYPRPENIRFSLAFKTRIVRIHDAPAGVCLGYDSEHPLEAPTRVATLCVGYADGYPRAMSHRAEVEIHGKRARVLGVVCMDLVMVDVGHIPEAAVGDEVLLLGGGIDIWTYAGFCDGYNNECIAAIGRRVPRVYVKGGRVVEVAEYM